METDFVPKLFACMEIKAHRLNPDNHLSKTVILELGQSGIKLPLFTNYF